MTLEEFLKEAMWPEPHVRPGQRLMNKLAKEKPVLYRIVTGTDVDCFYIDDRMWMTISWLYENWSIEEPQQPRKLYE